MNCVRAAIARDYIRTLNDVPFITYSRNSYMEIISIASLIVCVALYLCSSCSVASRH